MLKKLPFFLNKLFFNRLGVHVSRIGRNHDTLIRAINEYNEKDNELTIFDVGAHNGSSIERFKSLYKGKIFNIYAFEPSFLYEHLNKKYADDKTKIFKKAISDKSGKQTFYQHASATGSSGLEKIMLSSYFARRRQIVNVEDIEAVETETVSLDQFCDWAGVDRVHHLKIDVQGHESSVLAGSKYLLSKQKIDIIEVELIIGQAYEGEHSFFDIEQHLISNRYRLVALSPDGRFYNLEPHDIMLNPELQFDLIYCSEKFYKNIIYNTG